MILKRCRQVPNNLLFLLVALELYHSNYIPKYCVWLVGKKVKKIKRNEWSSCGWLVKRWKEVVVGCKDFLISMGPKYSPFGWKRESEGVKSHTNTYYIFLWRASRSYKITFIFSSLQSNIINAANKTNFTINK